jgi:hypothetical protein
MSTKELIQAELDRLTESDLEEVYRVVREVANRKPAAAKKPGVLAQLKEIRIDAPEDFSRNLRDYLYGDKKDVDVP